jgi:hypothetical protein
MTAEERAARCHELQLRLNTLDALDENERLARDFRHALEEAQAALEGSAEGAESAVEDIEKAQEALEAFNEFLGGTLEFVEGASEALGEVAERVEGFGESAGEVAGAIEEITSTMQQIEDLQNLSEASAQDMINGLGDYVGGIVDTLGPLTETIPALGAFLTIYAEAISAIAISAGKIEAEAASRDDISQDAVGRDIYLSPQTARQQRAQEIQDILNELDALDCYGAQGDGAENSGGNGYGADFTAAVSFGLRECNTTREQLEEAITRLNLSRHSLREAWRTLRVLQDRGPSLEYQLANARSQLAAGGTGTDRAQAEVSMLEDEQASLQEQIEATRERVRRALEDHDERVALVDPCYQAMITRAVYVPEGERDQFLHDLRQFDPNPDGLDIEAIRQAVAEDQRTSMRPVLIGGGVFAGALLLTAAIVIPSGDPEPVSTTEAPAAVITEQVEEAIVEEIVEKIEEQIPELDLADTAFPEGLSYKITKTGDPIPAPFGDIPNGVQLEGMFDLSIDCGPLGQRCTYAMGYETDTPPHPPYSVPPVVPWDYNGTTWFIETPALFLSASYPGGFECIYSASDVWELTVTNAEWDGDRWVATAFTGTLVREQHLDPELSAAAIAAEYCPPYAEATSWDVEATGSVP